MRERERLEWREIPGIEGWLASNYGDFHRLERYYIDKAGRKLHCDDHIFWSDELTPFGGSHKNDYLRIRIGQKIYYAHRLTALTFIDNPENKPEINHIDGNGWNNYVGCKENNYEDSNLEWVTHKENMEHASRTGLINRDSEKRKIACVINRTFIDYDAMKKSVVQLTKDGEFIAKYESIMEAGRQTNIEAHRISDVCNHDGYRKSAGGFQWIFETEYDPNQDYVYHNYSYKGCSKAVEQYDMEGNFIAEYNSILDACRENGFPGNGYISEVCKGKRKHYKNFIWKYKAA